LFEDVLKSNQRLVDIEIQSTTYLLIIEIPLDHNLEVQITIRSHTSHSLEGIFKKHIIKIFNIRGQTLFLT